MAQQATIHVCTHRFLVSGFLANYRSRSIVISPALQFFGGNIRIFWHQLIPHLCRIYASSNRVSIGSDNGLYPILRQAIIWSAVILSIGPLGTSFSEISIKIKKLFIPENVSENIVCEKAAILSRGDEFNAEQIYRRHTRSVIESPAVRWVLYW